MVDVDLLLTVFFLFGELLTICADGEGDWQQSSLLRILDTLNTLMFALKLTLEII